MAATEQHMYMRLQMLLTSKATKQIDFNLDKIRINAASFGAVSGNLARKQFGLPGVGIRFGQVPSGADAAYDPGDDVFDLTDANYGTTAYERAVIIHESAHAWLDIRMPMGPTVQEKVIRKYFYTTAWFMDEATAYVAGELFNLYDTTRAGAAPTTPSWATDAHSLDGIAHRIAKSIMNRPGAHVSAADLATLYKKLKAEYSVPSSQKTYGNNGVK